MKKNSIHWNKIELLEWILDHPELNNNKDIIKLFHSIISNQPTWKINASRFYIDFCKNKVNSI